jgi:putative ABC transport system permease protein
MMVVVKAAGDPAALVDPVRSALLGVDPGLPHPAFVLGSSLVERALSPQRNTISMAGACGLLALILSAIGVYGVVAFSVSSRTREIGLRMAVGASKDRVLAEIFRDAVRLALPGLLVGALLGVGVAASMQRFLLGINPADPLSLAVAAGVLFAVVVLASLVPARRASGIEPMRALRQE